MLRNLDLVSLRSLVAVADTGGVTKAAGYLHLTQSAVSMQLKRLEDALGLKLLDRSHRTVSLTSEGEQLLSYARRMIALNDEVYTRLTAKEYEGEIVLGVPHDIVYPAIPTVLQKFSAAFPRMRVNLLSSYTMKLRQDFSRGECDIILTTEESCGEGAETLCERRLVWIGAPGGVVWKTRPLRLAFEERCSFRSAVQRRLDEAGVPWELAVESASTRTVEASVSADLAVHSVIEGMMPPYVAQIDHGGALPELQTVRINLYRSELAQSPAEQALVDLLREAYTGVSSSSQRQPSRLNGETAAAPAPLPFATGEACG
ncbi:LysR family transcriptional regulator [Litoreibacter roseus]|uniref:LysR family transcriptional regulator n=1 Tax=Litoreibacter roseus TaxID=2601869 RepID=A0A6N6JK99_9RHOB|nr:LysR family transcriptional regulator [Litoreibacter roseus]GFE65622.1 LysR family transcriptional regulator [Litoreibacter roseus]